MKQQIKPSTKQADGLNSLLPSQVPPAEKQSQRKEAACAGHTPAGGGDLKDEPQKPQGQQERADDGICYKAGEMFCPAKPQHFHSGLC